MIKKSGKWFADWRDEKGTRTAWTRAESRTHSGHARGQHYGRGPNFLYELGACTFPACKCPKYVPIRPTKRKKPGCSSPCNPASVPY